MTPRYRAQLRVTAAVVPLLLATGAASLALAQVSSGATSVSSVQVTGKAAVEAETGYKASASRTATKTDTPLINVPQSITVVTVRNINDRAANGIGEAIAYVPGVQTAQGENNRETIVFRGNTTTGDFFVDGIRDDVQTYRDLYNIERLEVFKGPNAMIFGRGGIGGVVNRVTKQAGWRQGGEVRVEGGSFDHFRISGDVDHVVSDIAALRLTGVYQNSGGFRTDTEFKRWGINPTATFRPDEATTVSLSYEHFKDERVAERGVPSQARIGIPATQVIGPLKTGRSTVFGDPTRSPTWTNTDAATAAVEHTFSDRVAIRSRLRYADYGKFYQNIFPGTVNATASTNPAGLPAGVYAPGTIVQISAYNNAQRRKNLFNQTDLTVKLDTGAVRHTLLAGLELGRQTTDNVRLEGFFPTASAPTGVQTIFAPVGQPNIRTPDVQWRAVSTSSNNYSVAKVAAGYLQDQIAFNDQLQLIVGLRYDHFNVTLHDRRSAAFRGTAPEYFDVTDDLWSPRAGLIYKPVESASIYASYTRSYQPRAGDQLTSLSLSTAAFAPEKFDNYEVGAKWDVLPALNLSVAIYDLKRTNVIVPIDPNNAALGNELGGAQRTKGVELGAVGQVTDHLSVMGAYAYQDGKFTKAISSSVAAGNQLANLPKHSASLWTRYDLDAFGFGLGVIHQGKRFAATDNLVRLPSFTRVDAAVFYKVNARVEAQLNVENLLDEKYFSNANSNTNLSPGAPTTVKVALTARF